MKPWLGEALGWGRSASTLSASPRGEQHPEVALANTKPWLVPAETRRAVEQAAVPDPGIRANGATEVRFESATMSLPSPDDLVREGLLLISRAPPQLLCERRAKELAEVHAGKRSPYSVHRCLEHGYKSVVPKPEPCCGQAQDLERRNGFDAPKRARKTA
jgi:hypothetical protein